MISTDAELEGALSAASPGDVLELAGADFSPALADFRFADFVTVKSAVQQDPARFTALVPVNCSRIIFDGLAVRNTADSSVSARLVDLDNGTDHCEFVNGEILGAPDRRSYYGFHAGAAGNHNACRRSKIRDVRQGAVVIHCDGAEFTENDVNFVGEDFFKCGNQADLICNRNSFGGRSFQLAGDHADFFQSQGPLTNSEFHENLAILRDSVPMAGFQFNGHGAHNALWIAGNILMISAVALETLDPANIAVLAEDNWFFHTPGVGLPGGSDVRIKGTTRRNFIGMNNANKGVDANTRMQYDEPAQSLHYSEFFINAMAGVDAVIADFEPVPGSAADDPSHLAFVRWIELTNGAPEMNTVTIEVDPTNGSVVVEPDQQCTYTPNPGYVGPDAFDYKNTRDSDGEFSIATVTVDVRTPVEANDDNAVTLRDVPVTINVLANDVG